MAIGFSTDVASAILAMDEHWDGWGYAKGLRRLEIPLAARIINLAQVIVAHPVSPGSRSPVTAAEPVAIAVAADADRVVMRVAARSALGGGVALRTGERASGGTVCGSLKVTC